MNKLPYMLVAAAIFALLLVFLFVLVQIGLITAAFAKLGLTTGQGFLVLLATLLGSGMNLPVMRRKRLVRAPAAQTFVQRGGVTFRYSRNVFPGQEQDKELRQQIVAVNVGGCIIPCILSAYFLSQVGLMPGLLISLGVVTTACYALAKPVPGVGIGIPLLYPPLITAFAAMLLAEPGSAPHVAYISGCMGTLLGADVLHLFTPRTNEALDAPVLAIGGAGTFDGIFITGILAVLLS